MEIFDTRDEMIASIPKGGMIAELGVFKGEFSLKIDEICQPKELILIDSWSGTHISVSYTHLTLPTKRIV